MPPRVRQRGVLFWLLLALSFLLPFAVGALLG
jgi:hypothetical protein